MKLNIDTKGLNGRLVKNTMATWLLVMGILFYFLIVGCSCNDDEVELKPTAQISVVDVGVTEAWLRIILHTEPGTFTLKRNDSIISSFHTPIDTVFYDESLLPNHTYIYKTEKGVPLTITTMDTTSHDFIWDITTLGDGNSSVLYDVAIVNDTCVYAVGEIYKKDSTGQFEIDPYNFLHWNGSQWHMQSITYVPVRAVFAFSDSDIWVGTTAPRHWDGKTWTLFGNSSGYAGGFNINKIWGESSSNLYVIGTGGNIRHYNGSSWQKVESGTTTDINDIWGIQNPVTKEEEVYCAVTDGFAFKDRRILKLTNMTEVDSMGWTPQREVYSVWTPNSLVVYACGDGVFKYSNKGWKEEDIGVNIYTTRIRGTRLNDIFAVGPFGLIAHNNGVSWKLMTGVENGGYTSVCAKSNIVVAVGASNEKGIVLIGKRN